MISFWGQLIRLKAYSNMIHDPSPLYFGSINAYLGLSDLTHTRTTYNSLSTVAVESKRSGGQEIRPSSNNPKIFHDKKSFFFSK